MNLGGKKVLVTGGTGFIGGRLVEKLVLECGAAVGVLVRNFAHSARIARFPIELVHGDVTDIEAVRRAAAGCEVIFHCAYGSTGTAKERKVATVRGTENVAKAASAGGATRLVHVSTFTVYGPTLDGELDERVPRCPAEDLYAESKMEAEQVVFDYHRIHGLPVAVVQPTIVYGPFGGVWTVGPIKQLKRGRVVLVNGGNGLCNAVYVDDVIDAMLLAATRKEAVGEAFLVSGAEPVTWRQFFGAYERILGVASTVSMTVEEINAWNRRQKKARSTLGQVRRVLRERADVRSRIIQLSAIAVLYRVIRTALPEKVWRRLRDQVLGDGSRMDSPNPPEGKPIYVPDRGLLALFNSKTRVCIDKARGRLGYEPKFDFDRGMSLMAEWARWSRLT